MELKFFFLCEVKLRKCNCLEKSLQLYKLCIYSELYDGDFNNKSILF